ncbi:MAG: SOS response-associated peptidase [Paludibacter sp.]
MCFTVAIVRNNQLEIASRYYDSLPPKFDKRDNLTELPIYYFVSGFSHPTLQIIKQDGIFQYNWGLIPSWIKDIQSANDIRSKTLNAMGETVFEKPSFKKSIISQRCILPVTGFYEWRDVNGVKYPYLIHATENEIFSLASIYDTWIDRNTGEIKNTFSIITTPANSLMEKIHNLKKRMPLILSPEDETKWLDADLNSDQIKKLIKPFNAQDMSAYTISRAANNARNERNVAEILENVEYPELIYV